MSEYVSLTIDGKTIKTNRNLTVLEAAKQNGFYVPSLCYHPGLSPYGGCRLCIVEIDGMKGFPTACTTYPEEGMVVRTNTEKLEILRRQVFELILTEHNKACTTCDKNLRCELQQVAAYLGIEKLTLPGIDKNLPVYEEEPFFNRDYNLCILCGRCVRVCEEIRKNAAVDFAFRGIKSVPCTFFNKKLQDSGCEFCGACVDICPTGALIEKDFKESYQPDKIITTVCPYCGVGCSIKLEIKNKKIVRTIPDNEGPANYGQLCVKGRFGIKEFVHHKERLTKPLVRKSVIDSASINADEFVEVSWDEALELIAKRFNQYKGSTFAAICSSRCTNEDNYVVQKFTRSVMGTNNVDNCARLCHAPTVSGLSISFGTGGGTNQMCELENAKCIFAIGTNTTKAHPVAGLKVKKAVQNGARLIVVDPRRIELCKYADLWLQLRPGTDVALIMGIARIIFEEGLQDTEFIKNRCENFESFEQSLGKFNIDFVEKITGIPKNKIIEAARIYATSKPASIIYTLGITEHSHGTDNVLAVSNLAMITGNIGKSSSGVNPLRGQNNVQGACDMGCVPTTYPGYQKVAEPSYKEKFEKAWGNQMSAEPGLNMVDALWAALEGKIKALYIVGIDPALTVADANRVQKALSAAEFIVVQEIFLTETAKFADVILPGTSFAEKDGTFTNLERRVQRVKKAIEPVGDSKPDWLITCEIAKKMGGCGFDYSGPSEIMDEIASLVPSFAGISFNRLEKGIQWPCPDTEHPGTPVLHTERFNTPSGKGKLSSLEYRPPAELPDKEYPLLLTTGRGLYHFHTVMTHKVEGLRMLSNREMVWINPRDAESLGIVNEDAVKVISRRGEVKAQASVTDDMLPGTVYMTFHFTESPTNVLTNPAIDPLSKTPEYKVCAVKIEKL